MTAVAKLPDAIRALAEVIRKYGTCAPAALDHVADELSAALSARASAGEGDSPEDRFEHYVQTAIARSPDPLRQLGEYLSRVLDEDEFPNADRLLLQIATTPKSDDLAWFEQEIRALECRHHGDPSYDHDAYWMKREVLKLVQARKSRAEND